MTGWSSAIRALENTMKTQLKLHLLVLFAALIVPLTAVAQGTSFSYQGRLAENGIPVEGLHDLIFTVHDAAIGGNVLAAPIVRNGIMINAGEFVASLDFGAGVFTGPPRWLEVSVKPVGAANFTLLNPRQVISPTPYAIYAATAGSVANGTVIANQLNTGGVAPTPGQLLSYDGGKFAWSDPGVNNIFSLNGNRAYYNLGNVGIGTSTPSTKLTVSSVGYGFEHTDGVRRLGTYLSESGGWFGTRSANPLHFFVDDGLSSLTISTNGGVGVGTATPTAGIRLDVNGAVRLAGGGSGGAVAFGAPNAESGMSITGVNRADLRFDGSVLKLVAASGVVPPSALNGIAITTAGNVGIGTTNASAKLDVLSDTAAAIVGKSMAGVGVLGESAQFNGVRGVGHNANHGAVVGVHDGGGIAVYGTGTVGVQGDGTSVGVYARSTSGPAVHADGHATQARDKGGFVKAMAYIDPFLPADQYIVRCYNSQLTGNEASTSPCGITVTRLNPGRYSIDFGFKVDDRFISVTTSLLGHVGTANHFAADNPDAVAVNIDSIDGLSGADSQFFIFVY